MGRDELIKDIESGKYKYQTMVSTSARYTLSNGKTIPNPIVMQSFYGSPTRIQLSEDKMWLLNSLGGEGWIGEQHIEYENGILTYIDLFDKTVQSVWVLTPTTELPTQLASDTDIDYEHIIENLRADCRKRIR